MFKINKESRSNEQLINDFNKNWEKKICKSLKKVKNDDRESIYKLLSNQRHEEYLNLLCQLGIIMNFPDNILEKMKNIYVSGESLYDHFINDTTRGECRSMSTALSQIIVNSYLMCGNINMPLISIEHQWLEFENLVFDTTLKKVFPKELYCDIFNPANLHKLTDEEIDQIKNNILNRISTKPLQSKFRFK